MERVAHYLDASTEPKLKEVVERELIAVHMKTLIEVPSHTLSLCSDHCTQIRLPDGRLGMHIYAQRRQSGRYVDK
jgi:hypothetical protein